MSVDLSFLKGVQIESVEPKKSKGKPGAPKNPEGYSLRLYKNGDLYPSSKFVEAFDIEFAPRTEEVDNEGNIKVITPGNGISFFKSEEWSQFKPDHKLIFAAIIPRQGNINIGTFANGRYSKDGISGRDVMNATNNAATAELLTSLTDYYGVDWNTVDYVDFVVQTAYPMVAENEAYYIPRHIAKGERSGTLTYTKYNNIKVYPIDLFYSKPEATPSNEEAPEATASTDRETSTGSEHVTSYGGMQEQSENLGEAGVQELEERQEPAHEHKAVENSDTEDPGSKTSDGVDLSALA